MAKKLKVPKGGLNAEQPAEQPAEPTVADQAAELINSDAGEGAAHDIYKTGDDDAPRSILDIHGEVVLSMCRRCGKAESELTSDNCIAAVQAPPTAEQPAETAPAAATPDAPEATAPPAIDQQREDAWQKLAGEWSNERYAWERDVEAAKERHTAAAITQAQIKEAHKAAKEAEEEALEELRDLLKDEPQRPDYLAFLASFNRVKPTEPSESSQAATPSEPITSDAWRAVPITKLDLPDKLIERLQEDGLDTIGRLEDRRAEIAEHKAKWPKGIGEAKITKIEDALIDWLTKNRDQAAFSELQSGHASEQPAAEVAADASATDAPAEETTTAATDIVNDEAYIDAISARAVELDTGEPDCLADQMGIGHWEEGYKHYQAGGELRSCGLRPSPAQDDFIRGWLAAGKIEDWQDAEEPPAGEEPELQEAVASGPALFNPDDI